MAGCLAFLVPSSILPGTLPLDLWQKMLADAHAWRGYRARTTSDSSGLPTVALLEIETQIELAARLGLAEKGGGGDLLELAGKVGRQLNAPRSGLHRSRESPES